MWLGWLGSDQRMTESKSVALPLGYTPKRVVGEDGFEPPNPKELIYSQPRLATSLFTHIIRYSHAFLIGGCCRFRTYDPRLVRAMLSR